MMQFLASEVTTIHRDLGTAQVRSPHNLERPLPLCYAGRVGV